MSSSLLLSTTISSLAANVGHRGETLIMTELMNGILNSQIAKRLMLLLRGVEMAGRTMEETCYLPEIWAVLGEDAGLECLLGMLDEEEKEEREIRDTEEREIRGNQTF